MDDFLSKPVQAEALWAVIDRVVAAHSPRVHLGLIDSRVLLAACGGDAGTLKTICDTLQDKLPGHLAAVQDALRDQDGPLLREAAHKLCGMISAFSTEAGAVASDIEDRAACGQLAEAAALIERLSDIGRVLPRVVKGLTIDTLRDEKERR